MPAVISIEGLINSPITLIQSFSANLVNKQELIKENTQLKSKLLLIDAKLQRLDFLERENLQLQILLHSAGKSKDRMLLTEIIASVSNSFVQQVTINSGRQQGVYIGQPVVDSQGLFGQVVMVDAEMSTVMLITNNKSAVPVMVLRNGLQLIAVGTGSGDYLELAHVPQTADVQVGDSLVTSGLGKVFPAGYQVGTVKEIKKVLGERFVKVIVSPKAHIGKTLRVFLLWPAEVGKKKKI